MVKGEHDSDYIVEGDQVRSKKIQKSSGYIRDPYQDDALGALYDPEEAKRVKAERAANHTGGRGSKTNQISWLMDPKDPRVRPPDPGMLIITPIEGPTVVIKSSDKKNGKGKKKH